MRTLTRREEGGREMNEGQLLVQEEEVFESLRKRRREGKEKMAGEDYLRR